MSVEENREIRPVRKKRKLRWGRLVFVLLVLAVLLTGAFWGTVWIYDNFINPPKVDVVGASDKITQNEKLNKRINILLLGIDDGDSDAAPDEPKRTDAMMLASFDPGDNNGSVPAADWLQFAWPSSHRRKHRLHSAYPNQPGPESAPWCHAAAKAAQPYYVLVDWRAFLDVIDLIGGVDLYVEKDMYYEDPYADLFIDIKHGYQHLDGKRAGEYVRFRKDELGDIGRVQRQQKFMKAAAAQIFNIDTVTKIPALFSTVDRHVETDMNTLTMIKAANSFKLFGDEKVKSGMLYGNFDDTEGISYWATSREEVQKSLDEIGIPYMKDDEDEQE